jgi:PAS domain S-box-containing protein
MSENEQLLRLASDLTPLDLPVGVYVVTRDGHFVQCNRRAREILHLPLEGDLGEDSITRFYNDPTYREKMHEELFEAEARGFYLEKLLNFEVEGREIFVRDFTRSLRDSEGKLLGFVCCMTDVTAGERSNRLLDSLPAGVYKLDADDNCETANWAFARILGYDSPDEIDGKASSDFYFNQAEAARLRKMVMEKHPDPVTNFIAEMCRKDGQKIFVNINAHMVKGDDGGYAGREGTIIDVTRQERYYRILRDVPVGLNVIRHEGEKDVIEDCNEQFLALFDFPFSDPLLARGFDVRQLHASLEDYKGFKSALETAAKQGKPLVRHRLRVTTRTKDEKIIEISSQPLTDPDGNVVGRTGAMYDITQEAELRDRLDELTHDFGSVLHNYTTALLMVQLSTTPVIRSLAPDPFPPNTEVTPEQANEVCATPALRLAAGVGQLLELAREEGRAPALSDENWSRLGDLRAMLRGYKEEVTEIDARPVVLGEAALETLEFCSLLMQSHRFSRESVAAVRNASQDLLRVTSLTALHQMRDAVLEMDHQVRSLREFVTTNAREPEDKEICQIGALIRQVRSNLDNYARSRRIKFKLELLEVNVKVVRREILRALTDLLHNAIKYSWSRDRTKSAWVTIRTSSANHQLHIELKNWGVPIKREEIEQDLIFKIGYRGMHSGDRGRVGTGIGLADARRVARAHKGNIEVTSQPAVASWPADDYTNPFITTVTMSLPVYN